jgi:hypothetical protein
VTYVWRYLDRSGMSCGASREFEDRDEAEAWLGQAWSKLSASGIGEVQLLEGDRDVYRMSLEPDDGDGAG